MEESRVVRTDAVLVLGGTGKTGQKVVQALLAEGRNVVVAARNKEAAESIFDASAPGLFLQVVTLLLSNSPNVSSVFILLRNSMSAIFLPCLPFDESMLAMSTKIKLLLLELL